MTTTVPGTKAVFAEAYDVPIPYMERTRDYYVALGYDNPYRWASFTEVPFTPLRTPLSLARVGLITFIGNTFTSNFNVKSCASSLRYAM